MAAAVWPFLEAARAEPAVRVGRDCDSLPDAPRVWNTRALLGDDGRDFMARNSRQLHKRIESAVCVEVAAAVADVLDL